MTRILALSLFASTLCPLASVRAQSTAVVVQTGDVAPDGNGTFAGFNFPVLNDAGHVAFPAELTDGSGGGSSHSGVFRGDGLTGPKQIVRTGEAAPDGNGTFSSIVDFALNDAGEVAFLGMLTGVSGGANDDLGIFHADVATGLTQIARTRQAAPDGNGSFSAFSYPVLNDAGEVAFQGILTGTSGEPSAVSGIFRGDATNGFTQIARGGQAAPDGNGSFSDFSYPTLNDAGDAAFSAFLAGASGGLSNNSGIFRGDGPGGLTQIVRKGQAAPDGNGTFALFALHTLNDPGQVAFIASLTGTSGSDGDNSGIFRGDGVTAPIRIAGERQPAPDGNGSFSNFSFDSRNSPALNNAGQVAFVASLTDASGGGSDILGVFRGDGVTDPTQIAREGQLTPDGNGIFSIFGKPALNDAGQAAFIADLTDASGGRSDNSGIFFYDDALGLIEVARESDAFLGSAVTGLEFRSSIATFDDERSGLNNRGQVAYSFELADGREGIAIWTLPEPSTAALLTLAALALPGRSRADR